MRHSARRGPRQKSHRNMRAAERGLGAGQSLKDKFFDGIDDFIVAASHTGEGGIKTVGKLAVVEAGDGDIVRNPDSAPSQPGHRGHGAFIS